MKECKIFGLLAIVILGAVCAAGQWEDSMETGPISPLDGAVLSDGQAAVTAAGEEAGQQPSPPLRPEGTGTEAPSFPRAPDTAAPGQPAPDTAAPEQPTLRQVLESMKPPSLTDDESAAGSVWLHSKAGPDMAELASEEQEPPTSSGMEESDDTGHPQNTTAEEDGTAANSTAKLCSCLPLGLAADELTVKLVNGSVLSEALIADSAVRTRSQPAVCLLVLFYGRSCPFSAAAAPHVNALPRAFPDLRVLAVDAFENGSLNTRFGIIAVPTVLLFHNGRPQARFNQSEPTLTRLVDFVAAHTQLVPPEVKPEVTAADRLGPLPNTAEQRLDWYLVAAWAFIVVCAAYAGVRLRLWRRAADNVRNWWIEAEQHLHED